MISMKFRSFAIVLAAIFAPVRAEEWESAENEEQQEEDYPIIASPIRTPYDPPTGYPSASSAPSSSFAPSPTPSKEPEDYTAAVCTGPTSCDDTSCGNCKTVRDEEDPGCSCPRCQCVVCKMDPYCCVKQWDHICVDEAETLCPDCVIFPTTSPSSSPSLSMAPSYAPFLPNLYFTVSNNDWQLRNITGVYAAHTDGLGGTPRHIYEGKSKATGITATSCTDGNVYWLTDYEIMYGNPEDLQASAQTLYSHLSSRGSSNNDDYQDEEYYGTIYNMLGIAIDEAQGKIFVGANGGLYMAELDGSSQWATTLESSRAMVPALALDPSTGNLYYGGREWDDKYEKQRFFIRLLRAPYDTEKPRELYTPEFFHRYNGQPRDIAIDFTTQTLFFADNQDVYMANLDGTSPSPVKVFSAQMFNYDNVRALEFYNDRLYIGVFGYKYTRLYEADPHGYRLEGKNLTMVYNMDLPDSWSTGIRGIVVADCPPPTASPTPCDPNKERTVAISPRLTSTTLPAGIRTLAFVIHTEWEMIQSITLTIEKEDSAIPGQWTAVTPTPPPVVDLATGVNGVYVDYQTLTDAGNYRWTASVYMMGDLCQTVDTTDYEMFTLS